MSSAHAHAQQPKSKKIQKVVTDSTILYLRQIKALAVLTFRELIREKILWSSFAFGLLSVALAFLVSKLSFAEQARIALTFGLTSISLIGGLISIVMGSALIAKEIQNRIHFSVLTKPIWRWQYVVGRTLGLYGILILNSVLMTLILLGVFYLSGGQIKVAIFKSLILQIVEFGVLATIASIFSVFSTATLGAIITSGVWVMGHAMEDLQIMSTKIEPYFLRPVLKFVTDVFPDLTRFDVKAQVAHHLPLEWTYILQTSAYGLSYMVFALAIACTIFSRKEL